MTTLETTLNPFDKKEGKDPERIEEVDLERDENLSYNYNFYEEYSSILNSGEDIEPDKLILKILEPQKINILLQLMKRNFNQTATLVIIDQLVKESYENGYNDFYLDFSDFLMNHLLNDFHGSPKNKLKVNINGNVGISLGQMSSNCVFRVNGKAKTNTGFSSVDCEFYIKDSVEEYCGIDSTNCLFVIEGNVGDKCGLKATASKFYIKMKTGTNAFEESTMCEFETNGNVGENFGYYSKKLSGTINSKAANLVGFLKQATYASIKVKHKALFDIIMNSGDYSKGHNYVELLK